MFCSAFNANPVTKSLFFKNISRCNFFKNLSSAFSQKTENKTLKLELCRKQNGQTVFPSLVQCVLHDHNLIEKHDRDIAYD